MDFWVKNVGTIGIESIDRSDIFFGPVGDFSRMDYSSGTPPYWDYRLEGNHDRWQQAVTLKGTIYLASSLSENSTYMLKVVIPNGIFDETTFSAE